MVEVLNREGYLPGENETNLGQQLDFYFATYNKSLRRVFVKEDGGKGERLRGKILGFLKDNNETCAIWFSERMEQARNKELESQGSTRVFKVKCIDGRKPRVFEGSAHSLKTEGGLLALVKDPVTQELEPLSSDICLALSNPEANFLEMNIAHYDSIDTHHGCAAIGGIINDHKKGEDSVWPFLSGKERELVLKAGAIGHEYAGMVLMELTNSKVLNETHKRYMRALGVEPLKQVAVTLLADTRTMGLEIRTPLLREGQDGLELVPVNEQEILSTAKLTHEFEEDLRSICSFPMGDFGKTFNDRERIVDFYEALVGFSAALSKPETGVPHLYQKVDNFIKKNYPDLSSGQIQAFRYRMLRTVALQYLTGLHHPQEHPFADHAERFISIGTGTDYMGKYLADIQCFRMSGPDAKTAARRLVIAASVMDKYSGDGDDPHIIFFCTPATKDRNSAEYEKAYVESATFYRSLMRRKEIRYLINIGIILPIPVLISSETNEVLEVVAKNGLFAKK